MNWGMFFFIWNLNSGCFEILDDLKFKSRQNVQMIKFTETL